MSGLAPLRVVPCAEGWSGSVTWHPDMNFTAEEKVEPGNRYMGGSTEFAEIIRRQLRNNVRLAERMNLTEMQKFYQNRWDAFGVTDVHAEAAAGLVMLQLSLEKAGRKNAADVAKAMATIEFDTFFGKIQPDKDGWNLR